MHESAEYKKRRKLVVEFIEQRIEQELRITYVKVCELAGFTETLLRRIRNNPRYGITTRTAAGLDRALQLRPGSIERMLNGTGEPERLPGSPGAAPTLDDGAPVNLMDILRRWTRKLNADDAAQLAEDLLVVRVSSHKQGYDQGFDDGREAAHREG